MEYIDYDFEEGHLVQAEFFGNKRRVFCPRHIYEDYLSKELIHEFIPGIDTWEKVTRPNWGDDSYRLVRPDV